VILFFRATLAIASPTWKALSDFVPAVIFLSFAVATTFQVVSTI
jgi:hypothetical protein